jgi:hypothetical protein
MEQRMGAVLFTCPTTKMMVQHWLDDDDDAPEDEFRSIACPACTRQHFVNRKTGKLLGQRARWDAPGTAQRTYASAVYPVV